MYSVEYKWTNVEIDVTTISITQVKVSKRNPQFKVWISVIIQGWIWIKQIALFKATS